ncbi:MAG: TonB-dependent receptor [Cytophagales bacterium]|nr:TonB-dependent receptor [Cytophagales bacterium]
MKFQLFILVFLWSCGLFAQVGPFKINGHIISSEGDVLPNATILVNGKDVYTSDVHGDFSVSVKNHGRYTLQFTFIGYDTLVTPVDVHGREIHLDIILKPQEIELNEVIIVGDHFKTGRMEQSQTVQTVDAEFLKQQNAGTLINSIQKIPGISAINTGVGIAKPVIRGMSFNRVLVMDKGIKQEGQQWGADHGLEIDQYDPERIEIVKGPSSLLYGSDAIGGAIRILPPSLPVGDHLSGDLFMTYKTNNQLFGTSAGLQGARDDKFFRLRLSIQDFGDYTVPANSFVYNGYVLPIYNNRLKNTAGNERNVSLSGGIHKKWGSTSITISNFHQKAGLFPGAIGIPREYQLEDDGDSRNIDLPRQVVNHLKIISNTTLILGEDWLEMDLGYQHNDRREEGAPHAHGYQPVVDGNLALGLNLKTFSANIRYNNNLGEKINGVFGLQGQWQDNRHAGFEFLLPDFQSGNMGAYIYQEYSPSHKFSMNAGVRYDYGMRDIDAYVEPDYTTPESEDSVVRNPDIYRQFNNVSAALGFSYYPDIYFNTKLNIGTSFRMPTAPELSSNGVHHGTFRHERGDPDLDSERGVQADLNMTYQRNSLYVLITPFTGYYNQYIYLAPQAEFSELPAGGQVYQYTQHDAFFTGLECSFEYELMRNLHFRTAMEYVWNKNLETDLPLPFTPPFSIYGELEYGKNVSNSPIKYYFFRANYHYFADQDRVDRNEHPTPGYDLVTLAGGFDFEMSHHTAQVRLSVHNLFDTPYMNHLSRYRLLNLPEQGSNIVLSIKLPFSIGR